MLEVSGVNEIGFSEFRHRQKELAYMSRAIPFNFMSFVLISAVALALMGCGESSSVPKYRENAAKFLEESRAAARTISSKSTREEFEELQVKMEAALRKIRPVPQDIPNRDKIDQELTKIIGFFTLVALTEHAVQGERRDWYQDINEAATNAERILGIQSESLKLK